jgi:hypothetical protein
VHLKCGVHAPGFARAACNTCGDELLLPFSCKLRGICPCCNTRRMSNTAADLVDQIITPDDAEADICTLLRSRHLYFVLTTPRRPGATLVRAVRDWIDFSLLTEGPLFRPVNRFGKILSTRLTDQSVALIVKRWALEAGFDPAFFAGHSLRSGLATAAAKAGKSERSIMKQTGHRSVSVVRRYIRDAELFDDNAAAGIGL